MNTGNPNVGGLATWHEATSSNMPALNLGGSGQIAAGGCEPTFFGDAVLYDYQIFGI